VSIDSQRDSRVTVAQLLLHYSRRCTVCKQGAGRTVPIEWNPPRGMPNFSKRG
jgi:hypothetical protein